MNESDGFDSSTTGDAAGSTPSPESSVGTSGSGDVGGAATAPWLSRRALMATVVAALAVTTAAAGAVIGHEAWPGTPSTIAAPNSSVSPATPYSPGTAGAGAQSPGSPYYGHSGSGPGGYYRQSPNGSTGSSAEGTGGPSNVAAIAAKVDPALVDVNSTFSYQSGKGAGTGIVLTSSGEVITNNHVIDGATTISVTDVGNGKTYSAKVVGYDPSHDIAVLQLQGASGLQTATLGDSSKAAVGDPVVALGNAGGAGGTPTSAGGAITALNQSITASDEIGGTTEQLAGMIQVNADIQPGDSGGSLVNSDGQVIGIDTAASEGFSFSSSGSQADAIPIDQAISIAKQIESGQGASPVHIGATAMLGVLVQPSSGSQYTPGGHYGNGGGGGTSSTGATISSVISGDPAQQAGLAAGDVITSIDGQSVGSASALSNLVISHHPGDKIQVGWTDTSGQSHTGTVNLGSGPPA
jgi:S1-C subfamily serine protease